MVTYLLAILLSASSLFASTPAPDSDQPFKIPLGLPPIPWPEDNPYSAKKVEMGRFLYFDKRLSSDGTISCATCHKIEDAFADHLPVSEGIQGHKGTRNSPTVINSAYQAHLFWDGRAASLEEQAKGPLANRKEMTNSHNEHDAYYECHIRVKSIPGYRILCQEAFGHDECTIDDISKAIATFERTILSGNSPYDRYIAGERTAMTPEAIAGMAVFKKSGCANCHSGFNFTDGKFHNIGVGMDEKNPDLGRYEITKEGKDKGAFKTPTLRETGKDYPYMHDGKLQTLEEVIDYYDKGGIPNTNLSPLMRPLNLTPKQKKELISFLQALNGEGWEHFTEPTQFP